MELQTALGLHRAGRLAEAEGIYRRILAQQPGRVDVAYLLGLLVYQLRNDPEAVELIGRAVAAKPGESEYWSNLGVVLAARGRMEEAIGAYRRALELKPDSAEAWNNLGNGLLHVGRIEEAEAACRKAVEIEPGSVLGNYNLGNALVQLGRAEEAVARYRRALVGRPGFAEAQSNLGNALNALGLWEESAAACRAAIGIKPGYAAAHNNLGGALVGLGKLEEAIAACKRAIEIEPGYAEAFINLGNALKDADRTEEAIESYRKAIALRPENKVIYSNLAVALLEADRVDEALAAVRRALEHQPELAGLYNNLGGILKDSGRIEQAVEAYRRGVELEPGSVATRSNLILAMHYHADFDGVMLRREAEQWASLHANPHPCPPPAYRERGKEGERVLRVGYISPDFREHVAGHILGPVIGAHDRGNVFVACYSNVRRGDVVTEGIKSRADLWREIYGLSTERIVEQIRADGIDVLVDLALFTAGNRLSVFARRAAPVQVTYLAYPGTSGLREMDYRLSDPFLDPEDSGLGDYTEKTVRLKRSYWCYQGDGNIPSVDRPKGGVTFGCLNNAAKVSRAAVELFGDVMAATPGSRLVLHSPSGEQREMILGRLGERGVERGRVEFVGKQKFRAYMETLGRIDIGLDPIPFGGGITTCDTLWMGAPVVTLSGRTAVGRGGRSILSNIELSDLVAGSKEEYVWIASELAGDSERLIELRRTMRQRMRASPLMDLKGFVADLEDAYRKMWAE